MGMSVHDRAIVRNIHAIDVVVGQGSHVITKC